MNKEDLKEIVKEFLSPYINAMVDYKKLCDEKDKEIEKLKQLLEDEELCKEIAQGHRKEVQEREARESKEVKRLNNIIKQLENILVEKLDAINDIRNTFGEKARVINPDINGIEMGYKDIQSILKELKGDSSNE